MADCISKKQNGETTDTTAPTTETEPLADVTNQTPAAETTEGKKDYKGPRIPRPHKQRGPPEDGVPSKTKVMVANLPYDLSEEKVSDICEMIRYPLLTNYDSSRNSSPPMSLSPPRLRFAQSPALW
jgi:hypothetical protein